MIAIIDIGGTSIKYGIFNTKKNSYSRIGSVPTLTKEKDFNLLNRLYFILDDLVDEYQIQGVGICTAGIVDPTEGSIVYANQNIPNYTGTQLKKIIEEKYKIKCTVENDVNAALLGEIHFGPYEDIKNAVMFTVGTGIGGALLINSEIFHGSNFSAGEVGYSLFNGKRIEDIASTSAIVRAVKENYNDAKYEINGAWIFQQAKEGNTICINAIKNQLASFAELIINTISLINPELVLLGGGIMEQKEYIEPILKEELNKYANQFVKRQTIVDFASLGNEAGMLGAYYHYSNSVNK